MRIDARNGGEGSRSEDDRMSAAHTRRTERALAQAEGIRARLADTPSHVRAGWLRDAAGMIEADAERHARIIVEQGVKTICEARSEVARAIGTLRLSAEEATRSTGRTIDFGADPRGVGRWGFQDHRPVGTVLAITPFNDPLNLVAHKVGPALAAGCPIIVKPDPRTPAPASMLCDTLLVAGTPKGAVDCIEAHVPETTAMIRDPRIAMVSFTGGRSAGSAIAQAAAGKPFALEMGGVAVTILLDDADITMAVPRIVSGMIAAAGQNCLHVQRVIAQGGVKNELMRRLARALDEIRLGDPDDEASEMGPLIEQDALDRCIEWTAEAVAGGAKILAGGTPEHHSDTRPRFRPTLLGNPSREAKIVRQEVFGPIATLETARDLPEALEMAALSGPALAAAIFTQSLEAPRALRKLNVGQIVVNDTTDFRIDAMPFGGPGAAGLGREGVRSALQAMSEPVVMCIA
ncbi:MAG: aldehyde dehydrogenase family protein [Sulfitobacter sp.]